VGTHWTPKKKGNIQVKNGSQALQTGNKVTPDALRSGVQASPCAITLLVVIAAAAYARVIILARSFLVIVTCAEERTFPAIYTFCI